MKKKLPLQLVLRRGARKYQISSKQNNSDTSTVTKTLNFPGRLLMMSKTTMECNKQESFQTPPAFNEFDVLEGAKLKDIVDKTISKGSSQGIFCICKFNWSV